MGAAVCFSATTATATAVVGAAASFSATATATYHASLEVRAEPCVWHPTPLQELRLELPAGEPFEEVF